MERNNADSLINKVAIRAVTLKGAKHMREAESEHCFYCHDSDTNQILSCLRLKANRKGT